MLALMRLMPGRCGRSRVLQPAGSPGGRGLSSNARPLGNARGQTRIPSSSPRSTARRASCRRPRRQRTDSPPTEAAFPHRSARAHSANARSSARIRATSARVFTRRASARNLADSGEPAGIRKRAPARQTRACPETARVLTRAFTDFPRVHQPRAFTNPRAIACRPTPARPPTTARPPTQSASADHRVRGASSPPGRRPVLPAARWPG